MNWLLGGSLVAMDVGLIISPSPLLGLAVLIVGLVFLVRINCKVVA